jgi:hypothetical protein
MKRKCLLPMNIADSLFDDLCKNELLKLRNSLEQGDITLTEAINKTMYFVSVKCSGIFTKFERPTNCKNFNALLEFSYQFVLGFDS